MPDLKPEATKQPEEAASNEAGPAASDSPANTQESSSPTPQPGGGGAENDEGQEPSRLEKFADAVKKTAKDSLEGNKEEDKQEQKNEQPMQEASGVERPIEVATAKPTPGNDKDDDKEEEEEKKKSQEATDKKSEQSEQQDEQKDLKGLMNDAMDKLKELCPEAAEQAGNFAKGFMKGFNGEEKDGPEAKQDGQGEENKNDPMGQLGEKIGQACKSAMGGGDQDGAMDMLKKGLEQMCSKISGVGGGGEEKTAGMQQESPSQDQGVENNNTSPTMKMG